MQAQGFNVLTARARQDNIADIRILGKAFSSSKNVYFFLYDNKQWQVRVCAKFVLLLNII